MLSLDCCALCKCVFNFFFVIFGVVHTFASWVGYKSEVLLWGVNGVFICISITWV